MCLTAGDHLDCFIKILSARLVHCKVTVFPLVINICLGRNALKACKYAPSSPLFTQGFEYPVVDLAMGVKE
jgi:hypothetical protein